MLKTKKPGKPWLRNLSSASGFPKRRAPPYYVAHFGFKENSKKTVTELLRKTGSFHVKLTTENMGNRDLTPYMAIVDDIGSDRFRMVVDIGHARDGDGVNPFVKKEATRKTLAQCGDRLFHLHESFDLEEKPDHRPPLHEDGIIEWGELFAALKNIGYKGELLVEDVQGENPQEWLRMTVAFPQTFVHRYSSR